jgi:hypothetical protein
VPVVLFDTLSWLTLLIHEDDNPWRVPLISIGVPTCSMQVR